MALVPQHSASNRVIDTALTVTYARRKISGSWTFVALNVTTTYTEAWEYERHAVKSYRYVGMTLAGARACRTAMVQNYTRAAKASKFETDPSSSYFGTFVHESAGSQVMASISVQHEDGAMYSVVITVDETDTRTSLSASESFATLFSAEQQRDYDDETETVAAGGGGS